ncbi:MAG: winged helix DNA-binding protein [Candidatus Calescibacterium sp.]|jgi:DNA-binding MarR family transcriptional regulator
MTSKRENEIEEKIVMGLERVSELFFTVLSKSAKKHNLNRQQIQIILNLKNKPENLKTLQEKTNQDKSTLSKSLKELKSKKMIFYKEGKDKREKLIFFTEKVNRIDIMKDFLFVKEALKKLPSKEKETIYKFILGIIDEALRFGLIKYQNMCYTCIFFKRKKDKMFCAYLEKELKLKDVMIDCKDYMKKIYFET